MLYNLNASLTDNLTDPKNLPLIIILGVVLLAIIVLVLVMIIRTVQNKKRNRREAEEAARALASGPQDEEYQPDLPAENVNGQTEPAVSETAPQEETRPPEEAVQEKEDGPSEEEAVREETEQEEVREKEALPAEETEAPDGAEAENTEKGEENKMEKKNAEPPKKPEAGKKDNKPVKKADPKAVPKAEIKPAPKKAEPQKVSAANGKWVIEEIKGKFWLSLIAPNGQVMLESPTAYASLSGARTGVKTYQDNISAGRLEITEHKNGDSQVQVLNGRGGLLATSSTYSSRAQAENARDSIKRWASTTAVEEVAEK